MAIGGVTTAATTEERRVAGVIEPTASAMGFEIVRVLMVGGDERRRLQIMAEPVADAGGARRLMQVEDCAQLSRALSAVLDVEDPIVGAYVLEVSSPGMERPLTRAADFERFVGEPVRIETVEPIDGRRRWRGVLSPASAPDAAAVETEDGACELPLAMIAKARLEPPAELRSGRGSAGGSRARKAREARG